MPYKDREKRLAHNREYSRRHYKKNRDRYREQHRKYIEDDPERFKQMKKRSYVRFREKRLAHSKDYYIKNRDKILVRIQKYHEEKHLEYEARYKANYAVPLGSECYICGSKEGLERHHPDYNKPLDIRTICRGCHVQLHKGNIRLGRWGDTPQNGVRN